MGEVQPYFKILCKDRRGRAAELLMKLWIECLQLHAINGHHRYGESETARAQRHQCPCCRQGAETAHHFLFDCTTYNDARQQLFSHLHAYAPTKFDALMQLPVEQRSKQLLNFTFWGVGRTAGRGSRVAGREYVTEASTGAGLAATGAEVVGDLILGGIASFVMTAWNIRSHACAALNGRGTNGGNPEV